MTQYAGGRDPKFNPGGIKDRVDTRDFKFTEVGMATPAFDWSKGYDIETVLGMKIGPKDQNGSGSCGGQAWSYLAGILEAAATGSYEERSAKFIYAQTYAPGGGSYGRDNANIFIKQGAARETVVPSYENGMPPSEAFMERGGDIDEVARQDAKLAISSSYALVGTGIEEIARALRDNKGVILGINGQNNGTWYTEFPTPPVSPTWAHWVYAGKAKVINGVKYIGFLNSWGSAPGNQGWQWLSEDWFTKGQVWSAWTHILKTEPVPPSFHHNFMLDLKFGQNSGDISALQIALQIEGVFPKNVNPTGFYGDVTRRAVLAFRLKYKISSSTDPEGKSVGPLTRAQLNKLFL